MRIIPPRLNHLLHALLEADSPIMVKELAGRLGVSRRTVFREMENVDVLLRPYGLSIGTRTGEGICLEGGKEEKEKLSSDLNSINTWEPAGKQERHIHLALELLSNPEQQKLYYYAGIFKVSEATISYDLDGMEPWLNRHGLCLIRKPGYGISLEGDESGFRNALCAVLERRKESRAKDMILAYPASDISHKVKELLTMRFNRHIEWMTKESQRALELYVIVSMQRILSHNPLEGPEWEYERNMLMLANQLSDLLEIRFSVKISENERNGLAVRFASARSAADEKVSFDVTEQEFVIQRMAYRMIETFDPALSNILKLDEQLIRGLVFHLKSAVVRLKHSVELKDPLFEQLEKTYPEVLQKSRRAAEVLKEVADYVPESEAGFLATHFGAAIMRLNEQGKRKKNIHIGIVCANGIGTSYLMASQVKKHFGADAEIEVSGWGDQEDWSRFDLIISETPLSKQEVRVVIVSPVLTEKDIENIRENIRKLMAAERQMLAEGQSLLEQSLKLKNLCADICVLLEHFTVLSIEAGCGMEQLAKLAGYRFGDLPDSGRMIYEDLMKREVLSSQVIPSLALILLHTRTAGVEKPVFSLIRPEGKCFADPMLAQARSCAVMLIPPDFNRGRAELMGRISSALLENQEFYAAVIDGDRDTVYRELEKILQAALSAAIRKFSL